MHWCRDMVRSRQISVEDGTTMRSMLFMPGGLELHIGVRIIQQRLSLVLLLQPATQLGVMLLLSYALLLHGSLVVLVVHMFKMWR